MRREAGVEGRREWRLFAPYTVQLMYTLYLRQWKLLNNALFDCTQEV